MDPHPSILRAAAERNKMIIRHIGIDLGTNSTIMKIKDFFDHTDKSAGSQTRPVLFDGDPVIPSVSFVTNNDFADQGNFAFGKNAESCQLERKIYRNFKLDIISDNTDLQQKAEKIVLGFFRWMRLNYAEQKAGYFDKCDDEATMVSYPVKWPDELKKYMVRVA